MAIDWTKGKYMYSRWTSQMRWLSEFRFPGTGPNDFFMWKVREFARNCRRDVGFPLSRITNGVHEGQRPWRIMLYREINDQTNEQSFF
jgi:hypothetical protein